MSICKNNNCNLKAQYGIVNEETGMFEKHHCKNHKLNNEMFNSPPWRFRYKDMKIITAKRNVKLLDSEEEFIRKTKEKGHKTYLSLQCLKCLDIVTTTSINNFITGYFGCSCNIKFKPWNTRFPEFKDITKNRNVTILDTEEDFIEKTTKYGCDAYIELMCNICLDIVNTTSIDKFKNSECLGCSCNNCIPWHTRYPEFEDITKNRNVTLLETKEEFIRKIKENGARTFLNIQCNICLDIVNTTNIKNFIYLKQLGCSCNKNIPWHKRPEEFLEICNNRNVKLLNSVVEYIEKTKKYGGETKLKLQCLDCNYIVSTTNIHSFNQGNLGCKCGNSKSEKCLGEILEDIFPEHEFIKIKPHWIKNKKGHNLELDYYCEKLKLAFEYQGIQHEEYQSFFHKGDINNFYKQQEHDKIKKQICKKKGIKLICIPSKYDYTNPLEMSDFILDNL